MKSNHWLILFVIDALLQLVSTVYTIPTLGIITKPLLMILLAGYFISLLGNHSTKLKRLILVALLFSWFGDTFLMFDGTNPLFFILGLSSFLIAHIAYIISFNKFDNAIKSGVIILVLVLFISYSLILIYLLWPGLNDMKTPVVLYAIVLTLMGFLGVVKNLQISNLVVIGVVLFIISDSLLAYTKFVEPINFSRLIIMATYILAQFFIVRGISNRILSTS